MKASKFGLATFAVLLSLTAFSQTDSTKTDTTTTQTDSTKKDSTHAYLQPRVNLQSISSVSIGLPQSQAADDQQIVAANFRRYYILPKNKSI